MDRRDYLKGAGLGVATLTAGCSELRFWGEGYEDVATLTVESEEEIEQQPVRSMSAELQEGDKIKLEYQHPNDVTHRDGSSIVTVFNAETGDVVLSNARNTSESLQPDDLGVPNHWDWLTGSTSIDDQPDWVHRYQVPETGQYQVVWGYYHENRFNQPARVSLARASGDGSSTDQPNVGELVTGFRKLIDSGWATDNWLRRDLQTAYKGVDGSVGADGPRGLLDIYWREVVGSLESPDEQIRRDLERAVTRSRLAYVMDMTEDHLDVETDSLIEFAASALISQLDLSTDDAERLPTVLAGELKRDVSLTVGAPYSREGEDMTVTAWLAGTVNLSDISSLRTYNIQIPVEVNVRFQRLSPYHTEYPGDEGYFRLSQHEQEPTVQ